MSGARRRFPCCVRCLSSVPCYDGCPLGTSVYDDSSPGQAIILGQTICSSMPKHWRLGHMSLVLLLLAASFCAPVLTTQQHFTTMRQLHEVLTLFQVGIRNLCFFLDRPFKASSVYRPSGVCRPTVLMLLRLASHSCWGQDEDVQHSLNACSAVCLLHQLGCVKQHCAAHLVCCLLFVPSSCCFVGATFEQRGVQPYATAPCCVAGGAAEALLSASGIGVLLSYGQQCQVGCYPLAVIVCSYTVFSNWGS
jgi:hypothetical protein